MSCFVRPLGACALAWLTAGCATGAALKGGTARVLHFTEPPGAPAIQSAPTIGPQGLSLPRHGSLIVVEGTARGYPTRLWLYFPEPLTWGARVPVRGGELGRLELGASGGVFASQTLQGKLRLYRRDDDLNAVVSVVAKRPLVDVHDWQTFRLKGRFHAVEEERVEVPVLADASLTADESEQLRAMTRAVSALTAPRAAIKGQQSPVQEYVWDRAGPPGHVLEESPHRVAFALGTVGVSVGYGIALLAATAEDFNEGAEYLAIPVLGPFLYNRYASDTTDSFSARGLSYSALGLLQAAGVTALSLAYANPRERWVRAPETATLSPVLLPGRGYGLGAGGRF